MTHRIHSQFAVIEDANWDYLYTTLIAGDNSCLSPIFNPFNIKQNFCDSTIYSGSWLCVDVDIK